VGNWLDVVSAGADGLRTPFRRKFSITRDIAWSILKLSPHIAKDQGRMSHSITAAAAAKIAWRSQPSKAMARARCKIAWQ
jgi:hypothetical protein